MQFPSQTQINRKDTMEDETRRRHTDKEKIKKKLNSLPLQLQTRHWMLMYHWIRKETCERNKSILSNCENAMKTLTI